MLNFPNNPQVNDVFQRWQWDGTRWHAAPGTGGGGGDFPGIENAPFLPLAGGNMVGVTNMVLGQGSISWQGVGGADKYSTGVHGGTGELNLAWDVPGGYSLLKVGPDGLVTVANNLNAQQLTVNAGVLWSGSPNSYIGTVAANGWFGFRNNTAPNRGFSVDPAGALWADGFGSFGEPDGAMPAGFMLRVANGRSLLAGIRLTTTANSSPANGDLWYDGTTFNIRQGGASIALPGAGGGDVEEAPIDGVYARHDADWVQLYEPGLAPWSFQATPSPDQGWTRVNYGGGVFIMMINANMSRSTDGGVTWSATANIGSPAVNLNDMAFGNGIWVTVGNTVDPRRSTDGGVTWTVAGTPAGCRASNVTWGNNTFVATSASNGDVYTSPDGNVWTPRLAAIPGGSRPWPLCWGNGMFVAVTNAGTNRTAVSSDGITWATNPAAADNATYASVAFGNGVFVGVGQYPMVSADGTTWTDTRASATAAVGGVSRTSSGVTFGNGRFVVVFVNGQGDSSITSEDGLNWSLLRTPIPASGTQQAWQAVAFGDGKFVAVANAGTGNRAMTTQLSNDPVTGLGGPWARELSGVGGYIRNMTATGAVNWQQIWSSASSGTLMNTATLQGTDLTLTRHLTIQNNGSTTIGNAATGSINLNPGTGGLNINGQPLVVQAANETTAVANSITNPNNIWFWV